MFDAYYPIIIPSSNYHDTMSITIIISLSITPGPLLFTIFHQPGVFHPYAYYTPTGMISLDTTVSSHHSSPHYIPKKPMFDDLSSLPFPILSHYNIYIYIYVHIPVEIIEYRLYPNSPNFGMENITIQSQFSLVNG
jgi:hypothetical protein